MAAKVRVVNTFIDVEDTDDEQSELPVSAMKTEPPPTLNGGLCSPLSHAVFPKSVVREPEETEAHRRAPCLLGNEPLCADFGVKVTIKNTFIDVSSDDETDDIYMDKIKSEPAHPTPLSPEGEVPKRVWQPSSDLSTQEAARPFWEGAWKVSGSCNTTVPWTSQAQAAERSRLNISSKWLHLKEVEEEHVNSEDSAHSGKDVPKATSSHVLRGVLEKHVDMGNLQSLVCAI
ncbi:unnamed protein product [Symbiodinium natans]|uniref:Uncharacterized protein n=1 Tax=Symbiodinium natans TaxID=878477 RepID=A0A812TR84_9DINO|nr:unnamed protein product [Symbiodinium natans]